MGALMFVNQNNQLEIKEENNSLSVLLCIHKAFVVGINTPLGFLCISEMKRAEVRYYYKHRPTFGTTDSEEEEDPSSDENSDPMYSVPTTKRARIDVAALVEYPRLTQSPRLQGYVFIVQPISNLFM